MSIDFDDIKSLINEGIYGDDRMTDTWRDDASAALAVLLAEVKRLQSYAADCEAHAKFATEKATALERAAVVAWLRACEDESCVFADDIASQFAAEIERGEHRREGDE